MINEKLKMMEAPLPLIISNLSFFIYNSILNPLDPVKHLQKIFIWRNKW